MQRQRRQPDTYSKIGRPPMARCARFPHAGVLATVDGDLGRMFICPYDLDSCDGARCASGVCERSHEFCLIACLDCGELYEVDAAVLRLCSACVSRDARQAKEG